MLVQLNGIVSVTGIDEQSRRWRYYNQHSFSQTRYLSLETTVNVRHVQGSTVS